jgi:hypothetical protein
VAKYQKGQSGNPKGRSKGAVNKVTRDFKVTITKLLEDNADNVSLWLEQVAADDPGRALDVIAKLAEYAVPKLSRLEAHATNGPEMTHEEWLRDLK